MIAAYLGCTALPDGSFDCTTSTVIPAAWLPTIVKITTGTALLKTAINFFRDGFGGPCCRACRRRPAGAFASTLQGVREMVASPICGALAAAYLTVPVIHYVKSIGLPMPPDDSLAPKLRRS